MSICYSCANRRPIPGDCHSLCTKPGSDRGAAAVIMMTKGVPHGNTNVHNVPEDKIQQMKQRFSVKL